MTMPSEKNDGLNYAVSNLGEKADWELHPQEYREGPGKAYAWGRTARLIAGPHLESILEEFRGNVTTVDLACATPIWKQIQVAQYKAQCDERAEKLAGTFLRQIKKLPSVRRYGQGSTAQLMELIVPKKSMGQRLMKSALFDSIFSPTDELIYHKDAISQSLRESFATSTKAYMPITEPTGEPGDKGTWQYLLEVNTGITLKDHMSSILGNDGAALFINEAADYFTNELNGNLRKFRAISTDREDFSAIIKEAERSFPRRYRNTHHFIDAKSRRNHITADVRALPFKNISLYTCFEGWPFYGNDFSDQEHADVADRVAESLSPGGKIVVFPWKIRGGDLSRILPLTEARWRLNGLSVNKVEYTRAELMDNMSSDELDLSHRSPIFQEPDETFTVLVAQKAKAA